MKLSSSVLLLSLERQIYTKTIRLYYSFSVSMREFLGPRQLSRDGNLPYKTGKIIHYQEVMAKNTDKRL